jgi:hypothetical protein
MAPQLLEDRLRHWGLRYLSQSIGFNLNRFATYIYGLAGNLNAIDGAPWQLECSPAPFQSALRSMRSYPFVTVIEKADAPMGWLISRKQGTEWQYLLRMSKRRHRIKQSVVATFSLRSS